MRLSLFQRRFLLISASVVAVTICLGICFYLSTRRIVLGELNRRGDLLVRSLASQSVQGMTTENVFHTLEALVDQAARQPDVTFVQIEDVHGKALAVAGSAKIQGLVFSTPVVASDTGSTKAIEMFDDSHTGETGLGKVRLTLSLAGFQAEFRRAALSFAMVAAIVNVLALIPAYIVSRWLAQRVAAAAELTRLVGTGDYKVRLKPKDNDEMGDLERGFNSMVEALAMSRSSLEGKVVELTNTLVLLKQTQGQLLHADKIAAVGQLAGGVAHDFNNLLTVILFSGRALEDSLDKDDPRRDDVGEIVIAANRASDLTRQLLAFSRRQTVEPKVVDVNMAVHGMEKMLRRLIGEDVQLTFEPTTKPVCINIDPGQLEQVLMNLVVNARDALPEGGKIRVAISRGAIPEGAAVLPRTCSGEDWVALLVADDGVGMAEDTRSRIFEPFFTTKGIGKGTGLGLSTVYGIVEQGGGQISIASSLGKGTTFSVYFPAVQQAATLRNADSLAPVLPRRDTILLVEDEDQIRHISARVLRKSGYEVIETGSPATALELATAAKSKIQLLLTDVTMPGMNGIELARKLLPLQPTMAVLFMSGYTDRRNLETASSDPRHFMPKPFTPEPLLQKVQHLLSSLAETAPA